MSGLTQKYFPSWELMQGVERKDTISKLRNEQTQHLHPQSCNSWILDPL